MKYQRFEAEDVAEILRHEREVRQAKVRAEQAALSDELVGPYKMTWDFWQALFERRDVKVLADFEAGKEFQTALRHSIRALEMSPLWANRPERDGLIVEYQQRLIVDGEAAEQAQDRIAAAADESPTPQREAGKARYDELRTQMAGYLTTPNTPSDIKTVQMDKAKVAGESTPRDVSKKEALPVGVTRSEILSVFPPLRGQTAEQWKKMMSDPPKWMEAARLDPGRRGIQSIWNPALFAICLAEKGKMQRRPLGAIIGRSFPEYLPEWEGYAGSFN